MTQQPDPSKLYSNYFIISDLDGTLTEAPYKTQGKHLPISSSPTVQPIIQWLAAGGNVCVASTQGTNVFRQIFLPLIESDCVTTSLLSGSLVLAGFSGACIFRLTSQSWEEAKKGGKSFRIQEVQEYRRKGGPGGSTTCMSREVSRRVGEIALEIYREMFRLFSEDPSRMKCLSRRYRTPFEKLFSSSSSSSSSSSVVSMQELTERGKFIKKYPLICFQSVPRAQRHSSSTYNCMLDADGEEEEHSDDEKDIIAQISLLGIPASLFDQLFVKTGIQNSLEKDFSVFVRRQPNSVAIVRQHVDKGTVIEWMLKHPQDFSNFDRRRAFCVGDMPATVDSSMMRFSSFSSLPFFSVGKPLSVLDIQKAPLDVRRAVARGGFVEFGALTSHFETEGTAVLVSKFMHYINQLAHKRKKGEKKNVVDDDGGDDNGVFVEDILPVLLGVPRGNNNNSRL